jgi:hypothetical protein
MKSQKSLNLPQFREPKWDLSAIRRNIGRNRASPLGFPRQTLERHSAALIVVPAALQLYMPSSNTAEKATRFKPGGAGSSPFATRGRALVGCAVASVFQS